MSGGHDISSYGHISDRRVAGMSVRSLRGGRLWVRLSTRTGLATDLHRCTFRCAPRSSSIIPSRDTTGARNARLISEYVPAEHATAENRCALIGHEEDEVGVGAGQHPPAVPLEVRRITRPQRQAADLDVAAEDVEQANRIGRRKRRQGQRCPGRNMRVGDPCLGSDLQRRALGPAMRRHLPWLNTSPKSWNWTLGPRSAARGRRKICSASTGPWSSMRSSCWKVWPAFIIIRRVAVISSAFPTVSGGASVRPGRRSGFVVAVRVHPDDVPGRHGGAVDPPDGA